MTRRTHAAYQEVWLQQEKPEAVVISGWSKADKVSGVADGGYAVYVDIVFKDGSVKWGYNIPFDVGTHSWQFRAGVIDPDIPIKGCNCTACSGDTRARFGSIACLSRSSPTACATTPVWFWRGPKLPRTASSKDEMR